MRKDEKMEKKEEKISAKFQTETTLIPIGVLDFAWVNMHMLTAMIFRNDCTVSVIGQNGEVVTLKYESKEAFTKMRDGVLKIQAVGDKNVEAAFNK